MKIPKTVTILGRKFKVEVIKRSLIKKRTGQASDGSFNHYNRSILISDDTNKEDRMITFLHECGHAIDFLTGFSQIQSSDVSELSCETRAAGFYDVFKSMS